MCLFDPKEFIRDRILDTVRKAGNQGHILNLCHGVLQDTPEENVAFFFETVKQLNYFSKEAELYETFLKPQDWVSWTSPVTVAS